MVHEATSGSHAPLFWAKFHDDHDYEKMMMMIMMKIINKSCNPTHELTIFSFGGKPQQRSWDKTKTKNCL